MEDRTSLICIHGEETLGTSLHNIIAPTRGSKQSDSIKKARAQGVPHAEKKRRLNRPNEKKGRDPIATTSSSRMLTGIVGTTSTRKRGTGSMTGNDNSG